MANAQTIQLTLKAIGDFSDVTGDISQVQQMLGKLKLPPNLGKNFESIFADLAKETEKYQRILDDGVKKKGDVTGLESSGKRINSLLSRLQKEMKKIDSDTLKESFKIDPSVLDGLLKKTRELQGQLSGKLNSDGFKKLKADADHAAAAMGKISKTKFTSNFTEAFNRGDINAAAEALEQLEANHKQFNDATKENAFQQALAGMRAALDGLRGDTELQDIAAQLRQVDQQMDQLDSEELQQFIKAFQQGQTNVDAMTREIREFMSQTDQAAQSQMSFTSQLDQLKNQVSYFFGLTNAVYLLRNALRQALETVKELDEVMTQTAVVTDMSVGDMWDKLPKYTADASALGVAVKDLYAATTLYYQQGLSGAKVMDVGIKTMKMAAIANMEAEEATQAMTAALRGFNMEVNELNAERVSDVYSKLAAISASDTGQIATAMSKTASIAASANMEFETTAALLAQIIETTQEAPETAGTALKTIVARFSEVKNLRSKGERTGEDEEGEAIDVNKIDKALKSVGISMNGFFAGTEGLDSILLKLSEKWTTLDFETQRYIATMAAGSRQQSRFMAMMSDYNRTTELVVAAQNSAGASQQQWEKTTESLGHKLNQLKNAWDQFVLSIANNDIIKLGVDLLKGLLTVINGITKSLPGFTSGLANILIVWGALVAGGKFLNASLAALSAKFSVSGKAAGVSFKSALAKEFSGIGKIFTKAGWTVPPLHTEKQVAALRNLEGAQKEVVVSKKFYDKAMNGDIASDNLRAKLKERAASAERNYAAAVTEAGTALDLNATQQAAFSELTAAGIAPTLAAAAAQNGLTEEREEDIVATLMQNGMSEEAARAKLDEMVANEGLNRVKEEENVVDKLSLTQKLGLLASIIFSTKAKKAENAEHYASVLAKLEESGATWTLAIANWALNTSMIVVLGTILAIAAAIALLVVGIIAIAKAIENSTPEAKMKKLKEETEAAAQAADEAKQAYQDMVDQKKSYDELISGMQELTVGTQEWSQALYEANQQILDIIEKYPELVQWLESENGQLSIRDEGWEAMIQNQEKIARTTQSLAVIKQAQQEWLTFSQTETKSQYYVEYSDPESGAGGGFYEDHFLSPNEAASLASELVDLSKTNPQALAPLESRARGYAEPLNEGYKYGDVLTAKVPIEGELYNIYSQDLIDLAKKYGVTANDIYNNADKMLAFGQKQKNLMSTAIQAGASERVLKSQYGAAIIDSLSRATDVVDVVDTNNKEWAEGASNKLWREGDDTVTQALKDKIQAYDAKHGTTTMITKSEKETMANYYKTLTGQDFDTKEAGSGADDQLAEKIAEAEATAELGDYGDELLKIVRGNQQLGRLYQNNLDADYGELDIDGMDIDQRYKNAIKEQQKKIEKQKEDSDRKIAKIMGEDYKEGISKQIAGSYTEAQELLKTYDQIKVVAGEVGTTIFVDIFKGLEAEEAKAFSEEIASVDWFSPIEGAAALKKYLAGTDKTLKDFALNIGIAASATYSLASQVNELYAILGDETLSKLAEDGEITATEILELADSCEELRTVLDTTGVSVNALASYYEKLEKGTLSMVGASSNFIKVLEKLNAASNTIQDSFAFIDTFEPERSQTEIGSSFYEMQQTMRELYDKGAYGDVQLIDYVKEFIGSENWGDLVREKGGDYKEALDEVFGYLPENGENFYQSWKKFANMDNGGMVSMGSGESIKFNLDSIKTVENLRNELMEKLDISRTLADAMIADAQTFTAGLEQGLNRLSIEDALSTWLSGAIELDGKKIISQSELEAFAEEAELELTQLMEIFEQDSISAEISVVPYLNADRTLTDDMRTLIIEELKAEAEKTGSVDLNLALEMIMDVGLNADEAKAELLTMGESFENMPITVNGGEAKKVGEVIEGTTEAATWEGLVAGLGDKAVLAAQELSAARQGEQTAKAMTVALTNAIYNGVTVLHDALGPIGRAITGFQAPDQNTYEQWLGDNLGRITTYYTDETTSAQNDLAAALADKTGGDPSDPKTQALVSSIMTAIQAGDSGTLRKLLSGYMDPGAQTTKDGEVDKWENPYDKLHNELAKINDTIRERERLERRYQALLDRQNLTLKEAQKLRKQTLEAYRSEAEQTKAIIAKREAQIWDEFKNTKGLEKYVEVIDDGYGGKTVRLKQGALEARNGQEWAEGDEITGAIDRIIEHQEDIYKQQENLIEISDSAWETIQRGQDDYLGLEERITEALVNERQEEIDRLDDINSSINETNSRLLDALQEQINQQREARDNEKTEEELASKQRRLAYLQQDTSGANALDILQLQKEIDEGVESYTDKLIDQKVDQLREQNDKAADQRQRQIDILNAQLENDKKTGAFNSKVAGLIDEVGKNNGLLTGTSLETLLKKKDNWDTLSALAKVEWFGDLKNAVAAALDYRGSITSVKDAVGAGLLEAGQYIDFTTADGVMSGTVQENGTVKGKNGQIYSEVGRNWLGDYLTTEKEKTTSALQQSEPVSEGKEITDTLKKEVSDAIWDGRWGSGSDRKKRLTEVFGAGAAKEIQDLVNQKKTFYPKKDTSKSSYSALKDVKYKKYKTGGLADFTGPAWLDGTKSKPEYILNSDQTKAFFTLVDVLQGLRTMSQNGGSTENNGDNVYDIDINVESIGNDYDVEQMARAVRQIIVDDATYRNTNAINLKR